MQCLFLPLIEHKETYNSEYLILILPTWGVPLHNTHSHTYAVEQIQMDTLKMFALLARQNRATWNKFIKSVSFISESFPVLTFALFKSRCLILEFYVNT